MLCSVLPVFHSAFRECALIEEVADSRSISHNTVSHLTMTLTRLLKHAGQSVGLSSSQGALYSALFNIASGIGRIAFGVLADFALGVSDIRKEAQGLFWRT
jgi:hypothetical protein